MTDRRTGGGWRVFGLGLLGGVLGWIAAASSACDVRGSKNPGRPADCPACECKCDCGAGGAVGPQGPAGDPGGGQSTQVRDLLESANRKFNHGDGTGCIADLDAHDRIDPRRRSNDPQNTLAMTRAQCMMLAGRCDAGKGLLREAYQHLGSMNMMGPEQLEKSVESLASMYCRGKMSPRDQLLQGYMQLSMGSSMKRMTSAECMEAYEKVRRNRDVVKPRDDEDHQVISASRDLYAVAPGCFARAGDCKQARRVFDESFPPERLKDIADPKVRADVQTQTFEAMAAKCKPK
jgi:hypothetical protein